LIKAFLARGSLARRIATRAIVVLGAVYVGGLVMRSFPHDQVLIFPVGSAFPNATRFSASWRQPGDNEPRGGVTLSFATPPPLQIKQHADLPNGDYQLSIEVVISLPPSSETHPAGDRENPQTAQVLPSARGVQTNIERRVTLAGGETVVALAAGGF
jgi:hypothetical protein